MWLGVGQILVYGMYETQFAIMSTRNRIRSERKRGGRGGKRRKGEERQQEKWWRDGKAGKCSKI